MRGNRTFKLIVLTTAIMLLATGCGFATSVQDRLSDRVSDSARDHLAERSKETIARLQGIDTSELELLSSDTVTLQELHNAGINVGSYQIDCDQPLHMVVVGGMFDRENLFSSGVSLAGGTAEGLAMRLVAEIYDPERDMPLGMIGDPSGASLDLFAGDSSISGGTNAGGLMLETSNADQAGQLVPEAVCR
jgi:hypothetical protein